MVSKENIGISQDRAKHMLKVARTMEELSRKNGWTEEKAVEMFFLGYIHDIGYEYVSEKEQHPTVGGQILKNFGYKYWKEVFYHGKVQSEYASQELDMLNYADMTTSHNGEKISIDDRLADIKFRFGEDSKCYSDAKIICDSVRNNF